MTSADLEEPCRRRLGKILKTTPCKVGKVYSQSPYFAWQSSAIVYLVVYPSEQMVLKRERNILLSC